MNDEERREKGLALRKKLFEGVPPGPAMPERMSQLTIEHLFGDVWQGDELELEERSLITCAMLVALYRQNAQRVHFTAAKNLGIPRSKIEGMITHAAYYAGWPCAASAFRVLDEVWPV